MIIFRCGASLKSSRSLATLPWDLHLVNNASPFIFEDYFPWDSIDFRNIDDTWSMKSYMARFMTTFKNFIKEERRNLCICLYISQTTFKTSLCSYWWLFCMGFIIGNQLIMEISIIFLSMKFQLNILAVWHIAAITSIHELYNRDKRGYFRLEYCGLILTS